MKSIKSNKHYILLLYINLLLSLLIIKKSFQIHYFSLAYVTLVFISTIILWWFYKDILKKWWHKILFTIGLLFIIIIIYYFKKGLLTSFVDYYVKTINEFNTLAIQGQVIHFSKFKPYINLLLPISIIIIINIMVNRWADFILILMITFIISFWYIGYSEIIKENFFSIAFVNLFTYSVLRYIKYYKDSIKKGLNVSISINQAYYSLIFSSLIVATLCVMFPKDISWKYSNDIKKKISDSFKKDQASGPAKANNSYDLSFAGYSNSSKQLGGPIVLNDLIAFKVESELPHYLRGITKDYYDGHSWINSKNEYILKNEEISYNENIINAISKKDKIVVYPGKLKTGALIAPMYSYDIILSGSDKTNKIYYNFSDKTLLSEYMIDEFYTVNFYPGDIYLINDKVSKPIYLNFDKEYKEYRNLKKDSDKYNIYDKYLQIPDNISPETYKLVSDITKDCNSDLEKIYSIRKYLRDNYKYSLNVSEVPINKEFIDYFINEEKKGYCTYFATTATMFCRIAGVPARYVEGFNMTNKKDEDGLYLVSNKNAHAWTEILMNPTIDEWGILDCVPDAEEQIRKEEEEKLNSYNSNNEDELNNKKIKKNKTKNEELELSNEDDYIKKASYKKYIYTFLGFILVCFILKIIYLIIRRYYICNNSSIKPLFLYTIKKLKIVGIKMPNNVTEMEFVDSLDEIEFKDEFKNIIENLYAEVYGNKTNDSIDKKKFYVFLEKYLKKKQGFVKYYVINVLF